MVRLPPESQLEPPPRRQRLHDPARAARLCHLGALVDVDLDEARQLHQRRRRFADQPWIEPCGAHRVRERHALGITPREHLGDLQPPYQRLAPERRGAPSGALLVRERDHRERNRGGVR
jgi:hypothetical protein